MNVETNVLIRFLCFISILTCVDHMLYSLYNFLAAAAGESRIIVKIFLQVSSLCVRHPKK